MITPEYFDMLDNIARKIRKRPHEVFGEIVFVICGDFLQLKPVRKNVLHFIEHLGTSLVSFSQQCLFLLYQ